MRIVILSVLASVILGFNSAAAFDKLPIHLIGVGLGEGLGIYSSVTGILYGNYDVTKAAGYANIGLLAVNAAMGMLTILKVGDYDTMVTIHKIIGYTVFAASLVLTVSAFLDPGVQGAYTHLTSAGYSVFSAGPIILFMF